MTRVRITCNNTYKADEQILNETVFEKYGYSSPSSEREIICLALTGNKAALKSYADLLFYKKINCRENYKKAFPLYCQAAGITFEGADIKCTGDGTPLAYYVIGYYLVNYRTESILKRCEAIDVIEDLTREERLSLALDLAVATLSACKSPAAVNLIGRIINEIPSLADRLDEPATAGEYFEQAAEGNGTVLSFDVMGDAEFSSIEFATPSARSYMADLSSVTGIGFVAAAPADSTVFDLNGRSAKGLKKGVNIVRDATGKSVKVVK